MDPKDKLIEYQNYRIKVLEKRIKKLEKLLNSEKKETLLSYEKRETDRVI